MSRIGGNPDPLWVAPSSLAGEVLMVALTLMKTLQTHKLSRSVSLQRQLSSLFLQNGMIIYHTSLTIFIHRMLGLVYFVLLASMDVLPIVFRYGVFYANDFVQLRPGYIVYFIDTVSAVLVTRFILSLRSHDLPRSNVPGEFPSQTDQSAWSSRLVFLNMIKSIDIVGNLGADLDHGEEREDGILADGSDGTSVLRNETQDETVEGIDSEPEAL
ncbi:hypothetical protein NLI96_g8033 [Meripilus lineatus]|uniref:Uncharacterized protein n=1 Tax=Meripilus lineatus TaxID=2056292 RepID=A0AAD5UY33_9APHY|nr:hypothetical protein NLI96_g8033 [Physisporinus lineatus]